MELPKELLDGEWPCAAEIALLQRAQSMQQAADDKLRKMTRDFRAHRFYPRRTEVRALQMHVHHRFARPVEATETSAGTPGRWILHVQATDPASGERAPLNLGNYFRKVSIELDPRLYSDSVVEWTCFQRDTQAVGAIQVARTGSTPHTVRIKLLPSQTVDRFTISDTLRTAIGPYLGTAKSFAKSDIVMAMWEYVKRRNLIKEDDYRVVTCDAMLAQLFQCASLPFASIVVALRPHLESANAVDFEYHLSLNGGDDPDARLDEQTFEVDVGYVDPVERSRDAALHALEELRQEQHKELELLQKQQTLILARLQEFTRKHAWMQQLAHDPAGFVTDVARSQQEDQQLLTAENETDEINVPHPHQFQQPWVREIVHELLVPRTAASN